MMSKLLLCFLFFLSSSQLLSSSFSFPNSTKPLCSHHQNLALLQLKQSFVIKKYYSRYFEYYNLPSYPKTESWKKGSDCCSWDGVTCDWVTGHVIELDLSCSWLFGTIHSNTTLFLFPHLQKLNLAFNNFSGSTISAGFGRFSSLTHLNLSESGFSGLISPEISHLSNLVSLDLSWNSDAEFAPHGFNSLVQNLTKLQKLHLRGISISSIFPNSLLNQSSLISLDLSQCGLHGRFPDHDIHLPKLKVLDLWWNNGLSGNFPRFSENNSLMELYLSSKNFSGGIPASIDNLKSLKILLLYDCGFLGSIPTSIGNLKSLQALYLSFCEFSGSIPASLENLTQITNLVLSGNYFRGEIPDVFNNLRKLKELSLYRNNFSGKFPLSIGNLTKLHSLDLGYNKLEGSIPSHVNGLSNLSNLYLDSNLFDGTIPSWLFDLPSLNILYLGDNNLSGILETSKFRKLRNLTLIDLHSNLLQGPLPIPPNSTILFSIANNNLSGEISPLICKVHSIRVLDLSDNNLSGMLPHCLGNSSKDLSVLNLRRNRFHGTIPQTFLKGNSIRNLDFNDNQLEGPVPRSLIICRKLEVLNLGNNKINDTFPHWLGTLSELQVLVLRSNNFHGHIGCSKIKSPFMSLRIIDLAHNDFEGDLPKIYLRGLKATMNVDEGNVTKYMGENYYQDSVMVTIKGLEIELVKILTTFTTIDLSSNKFQGEIPKSIGNLNSLRELNLSHNNLTGHIPSSFGNLKLLESLDLSSNELIGSIPQQLTSLTFLEVLNLSQNHLTGFIPQGNQFDTFGNDSYNENSGLCGFPLSKKCIADETLEPSKEMDVEFDGGFDWKITLMGYGCGLVIGLSLGCLIFLTGKPKWFVWIIEENIHKKIIRSKRSTCRQGARRN